MYLTSKSFYITLCLAILGIGILGISGFIPSNKTVFSSNTPARRIVLSPLTTEPVRASQETIIAPTPTPTEQPTTPTPTPSKPKPILKAATSSVQPAPTSAINCSGGFASEFLCLLNQYRATKGKSKLSGSSALSKVALTHSTWMYSTGTFSHVGIDGSRLGERCAAAGITCRGENLAFNISTAQELLKMWSESPSHNANLLGDYKIVGFGSYGSYTTLLFN